MPKKLRQVLALLVRYAPQRVYLFGSYARGEQESLSDIDLVIVKETDQPFFDRIREVLGCLKDTGRVDVLVYTPSEFEHMKQSGNAFY